MKSCPACKTAFPERTETCPKHGGYLGKIQGA
jgi:RNA polymerase subunit RPABC4/transcription elongation factor Spt4